MRAEEIEVIATAEYLDEIVNAGWTLVGPRKSPEKDLRSARNYLKREITFHPEHVLAAEGFAVVPPSPFTHGHQLMFRDDGELVRYTRAQYTLASGDAEVPLYVLLKEDEIDL